jgi:uncharacterized membrane protein
VAYALGFLSGIAVFFLEDRNQRVKWHGAQSMVTFGALIIGVWVVNTLIWSLLVTSFAFGLFQLFSLLTTVLWLGVVLVWAFLVFKAYQGETVRVPVAAGIADSLVGGGGRPTGGRRREPDRRGR